MSDVAEHMRMEITGMAAAGQSEEEIVEHYKALYGERILIVPDGKTGKVLFALPLIASLLFSGMFLLFLRRMLERKNRPVAERRQVLSAPVPKAILDQIRRETEEC